VDCFSRAPIITLYYKDGLGEAYIFNLKSVFNNKSYIYVIMHILLSNHSTNAMGKWISYDLSKLVK